MSWWEVRETEGSAHIVHADEGWGIVGIEDSGLFFFVFTRKGKTVLQLPTHRVAWVKRMRKVKA